jgi:pyruvate/2-oxoglutarate dehydrogenase complex dihydrolipoamide dehydrogenase (E3) component
MTGFDYDLIIIGAGSGGISAANFANGLGKKVAMIEKAKIGGDCTWFGCVPSKALLNAARIAHHACHVEEYGMKSGTDLKLDTSNIMAYVRNLREGIYEREKPEVWQKKGIDVYNAGAGFLDNHKIRVNDRILSAKKFIIATGSRPVIPPVDGLNEIPYITDETIFELKNLPKSMITMGGGPLGIELSSAFVRLGVDVTVILRHTTILPRDEPEMSGLLAECLKKEGMKILTEMTAEKFYKKDDRIILEVRGKDDENLILETDSVLVATGRKANVEGLDLEKAGVVYTERGIETDKTLRTTAKNIYAVGDVLGTYQFSHIAEYQAVIAVKNAMLPFPIKEKVNYEHMVWATFTDPELAHSGLTEAQAREKHGDAVKVYRFDYNNVDRAIIDKNTVGFAKFIIGKGGRLLGIHILGERATEILHEAQVLKVFGIPFHKVAPMVHIYPGYGDLIKRSAVRYAVDRLLENPVVKLLHKTKQ